MIRFLDKFTSSILKNDTEKKVFVSAVILAAGSGTRFSKTESKQLSLLDGMPVVAKTISVFEGSDRINEIIVIAKEDEIHLYKRFAEQYGFKKIKCVIRGGNTRQESAFVSLSKISPKADYILVHDAARPLVTDETIEKVIKVAIRYRCATAACKSKDTVKITDNLGFVTQTTDRDNTYLVQTPQVFLSEIYRGAHFIAKKDGFTGTDDCSLVEHSGFKVKIVECGYDNIKITVPGDLKIAELILKERKNDGF